MFLLILLLLSIKVLKKSINFKSITSIRWTNIILYKPSLGKGRCLFLSPLSLADETLIDLCLVRAFYDSCIPDQLLKKTTNCHLDTPLNNLFTMGVCFVRIHRKSIKILIPIMTYADKMKNKMVRMFISKIFFIRRFGGDY